MSARVDYPKISIITPNYNGVEFIEDTILSVISQNYPNLEYIIIDGGSTDGSIEIIKKYEKKLSYWVSEPDAGLYFAIQKGFDRATGEIFGWINSDDKLHPNSLFVIAEIFNSFQEVNWLTGCASGFDKRGSTIAVNNAKQWSKYHYYLNEYKWIQQESTFWRKSLRKKAGATLNLQIKYAADFELWLRFFRYEKLFTVQTILGGFRLHSANQLSFLHREEYLKEVENLINNEVENLPVTVRRKLIFYKTSADTIYALNNLKIFNVSALRYRLEKKIYDLPNIIFFDHTTQSFQLPR